MSAAQAPPATTRLWHPLASMPTVRGDELLIERGEDCEVWDADGRRLLDATASLWYCHIGHGRPEMADAAAVQMRALETYHTFQRLANRPALELAARLADAAPLGNYAKVVLASGGSDGIDAAAKLVRLYWSVQGRPDKQVVIARERSYHGLHAFGTSLGGMARNRRGFGRLVEDVARVDTFSASALEAKIAELGADRVAAFVCEPVVAGAGVFFPPEGYLAEVRRICDEHSVLLIADEVVTAFGRAGAWFACERYGISPDLLVFAKGVASGYLPLGGVVVSAAVAEPFWAEGSSHSFRHGVTFAGHATVCAVALRNLEILTAEDLVERSRALERPLGELLARLRRLSGVVDVRTGAGLMGGVQLATPELAAAVVAGCLRRGVLTRVVGEDDTLQISPPLTVSRAQLEEIATTVGEAIASA